MAKVPDVTMLRLGNTSNGTLHLTTYHMIFHDDTNSREIWIGYPIIAGVERRPFNATVGHASIRIRCRDFSFICLNFNDEDVSKDAFESMMKLTCVNSVDNLYAFMYKPGSLERKLNSWDIYDPEKEYRRMGAIESGNWRFTSINNDYKLCPTYPSKLVVPQRISDTVLSYGAKFRSKCRLPVLSYYHKLNGCTITRCSQPMVGIKQKRSAQDEKVLSCIFSTTKDPESVSVGGGIQENLIVDARPTTNAMAQAALGAGSEIMENYKNCKKVYLGIDNIHVMRDSLNRVVDALKYSDVSPLPPSQELLAKSGWLKHLSTILDGAILIAEQVHYNFSHALVHCSDGWDRTAQLCSLAQIFLDPYFRTLDGFITLVEKEWLSLGHRFAERSGHLSNEKHFTQLSESHNNNQAQQVLNSVSNRLVKQSHVKYTSPVFHQFLDCVYQLIYQQPDKFEYNERFLRRLLYHTYSCQYGTFLYDNERERVEAKVSSRSRSVWDYFLARRSEFTNPSYAAPDSAVLADDIVLPDMKRIRWWSMAFGRTDEDMNPVRPVLSSTATPRARSATPDRVRTGTTAMQSPRTSTSTPVDSTAETNDAETNDNVGNADKGADADDADSSNGTDSGNGVGTDNDGESAAGTPGPGEKAKPYHRLETPSSPAPSNSAAPFDSTLVQYSTGEEDGHQLSSRFDSMTLDLESSTSKKGLFSWMVASD